VVSEEQGAANKIEKTGKKPYVSCQNKKDKSGLKSRLYMFPELTGFCIGNIQRLFSFEVLHRCLSPERLWMRPVILQRNP
jgi:hypothetical protein